MKGEVTFKVLITVQTWMLAYNHNTIVYVDAELSNITRCRNKVCLQCHRFSTDSSIPSRICNFFKYNNSVFQWPADVVKLHLFGVCRTSPPLLASARCSLTSGILPWSIVTWKGVEDARRKKILCLLLASIQQYSKCLFLLHAICFCKNVEYSGRWRYPIVD